MKKKVLLLLYYWPPAGGPGVQRWIFFVRYMRDFGVEPVLFLPDNPHYPLQDPKLKEELPQNLIIYKSEFWEPYKVSSLFGKQKTKRLSSGIIHRKKAGIIERMLLWVRGNLFIPDARKFWIKPAVKALPDILKAEGIDTIITSGPPHSLHLIGLELKKVFPVRWIADFRDPWTAIGYMDALFPGKRAMRKHISLEREVLQSADAIITTSEHTRQAFQKITTKPISVITNGYNTEPGTGAQPSGKFVLAHIGSLLSDRNPEGLWLALRELCTRYPEFKRDLQLEFTGVISQEILQQLADYGLDELTYTRPYVPHQEALLLQRNAQILLLIEIDAPRTAGILPGKIFEYLAAKRPILAVGPAGWEATQLIAATDSGRGFSNDQIQEICDCIWEWYGKYQKQELIGRPRGFEQYHRKSLTERLVKEVL
ncbi:MAG: hypothetical protein RLZZ241_217 [Bacteroidota bacterium]